MKVSRLVSVGLAMFTMLFGAGNVFIPLSLGRDTGSQVFFTILGLTLTGILVPLLGLVSSSLYDGNYKKFFATAGSLTGMFLALMCMLLIGPFGATPRCIILAHSAVSWYLPRLSLFIFSILIACLTFGTTIRRSYIVDLMGRFFGPIKIILLLSIIVLGFFSSQLIPSSHIAPFFSFWKGFVGGYATLDLMATIFFSGLIVSSIKAHNKGKNELSPRQITFFGLKAGIIGGCMLGIMYTGFCLLAAKYSTLLVGISNDQLLGALARLVLGPQAGIIANLTMLVACLTTAIALTAVFADYLHHEFFLGRISYMYALLMTIFLTFVSTNLGFERLASIIEPAAMLCYPALIVLSFANIAHILWGFKYVQSSVIVTFIVTLFMNLISYVF